MTSDNDELIKYFSNWKACFFSSRKENFIVKYNGVTKTFDMYEGNSIFHSSSQEGSDTVDTIRISHAPEKYTIEQYTSAMHDYLADLNQVPRPSVRRQHMFKYFDRFYGWFSENVNEDLYFSDLSNCLSVCNKKTGRIVLRIGPDFLIETCKTSDYSIEEFESLFNEYRGLMTPKKKVESKNTSNDGLDDFPKHTVTPVKKEVKMSNSTTAPGFAGFVEKMKRDAVAGGQAAVATQITKLTKQGMLKLMKDRGSDEGAIASIAKLLDTDGGTAFVHLFLGIGMEYVPVLSNDPRVQVLAPKFREKGFEVAGNAGIEALMETFLPIIQGALNSMPAQLTSGKVRVTSTAPVDDAEDLIAEEELQAAEAAAPGHRATHR